MQRQMGCLRKTEEPIGESAKSEVSHPEAEGDEEGRGKRGQKADLCE